jgi:acetyl-CoA acyltransferase
MNTVFAVDACRTPVGKIKGALAGARPDHLTAEVIRALAARNPWLDPAGIDDVYWGAANQAGEDNRNVARMGVLLAGLPVEVPGATVNRLCGSGMEAISAAARAIAAGEADICLAGGTESMTRAPFVLPRAVEAFPRDAAVADTRLGWRLVSPLMAELYPPVSLGETAENVAERYGVDRDRQDRFALASHQRAARAAAAGVLAEEIIPVTVPGGGPGGGVKVTADEGIRPDLTLGELAERKPAFRKDGTVTGGNSSPLNDGAAGLVLMSERAAAAAGAEPIARYAGTASAGVHPDFMGIGPVPALTRLLARAGWRPDSLGLAEVNEAFAAQAIAVIDELKLDPELVNVNGGAIAIGHPLGCSGARITTTLLHEMRRRGAARAAATMCIGVGQGIATLWEAA